ncbi:unnamed protein product [Cuscuta europaea]|uniref:Uncharacterized protein n=1 Tax=Cuscuta europaea TaxID=41803 RepID=A0A9P1E296_CUSEU|nr:unnamed protein product [Cuscuta europaea]
MDIDNDISGWILEFILRQSLDDATLTALIRVLPAPLKYNRRLAKIVLLREIESNISNGSVSEKTVGLLEKYEEIDFQEGIKASNALREAYCAVAVDCTVRVLKNGSEENVKAEYLDAVKRIWSRRICRMEKEENAGLLSADLSEWRELIETTAWEDIDFDNVMRVSEALDAVGAVKMFVKEAMEKMGPSFLEYMAETLGRENNSRESLPSQNEEDEGQIAGKVSALPSYAQMPTHPNNDTAHPIFNYWVRHRRKGKSVAEHKHLACKRISVTLDGTSRGNKVADSDSLRAETSNRQYRLVDTPEVNIAQEELVKSSLGLQAVVMDPLPDALLIAANIDSQPSQKNRDTTTPAVSCSGGVIQTSERNISNQNSPRQVNPSKQRLMERNSTANVFEWDDSINDSDEGSPSRGKRPKLPSVQKKDVSPLREYQMKNLKKRRKLKKWSSIEEDTLRTGVQKLGRGNWKLILQAYGDIFEDRTEVDLKDKWRNMTR